MRPSDALTIAASVVSLQRSQWRRTEDIRRRQLAALDETLAFALERVPHYRSLGIAPGGDPHERLSRFPPLTKRNL